MKIIWPLLFFSLVPALAWSGNLNFDHPGNAEAYVVPAAVGLLGSSLVLAHLLAPETYSWKVNTLSQLGAQNYAHAWVMRTGFIGFGSLLAGAATWDSLAGKSWIETVPLMAYGASVAITGLYSAAPFDPGVPFSPGEATIHTVFANVAGAAFSAAMLSRALTEPDPQKRVIHLSGLAFVVASSAMFKLQPESQGIWQRVLWTGSLAWLSIGVSF